jgi:hypothetical protein
LTSIVLQLWESANWWELYVNFESTLLVPCPLIHFPKLHFCVFINKDISENYLEHFIPIRIYMFIPYIRFWSITSFDAKLMKFSINIQCTTLKRSCRKYGHFISIWVLHHTFKSTLYHMSLLIIDHHSKYEVAWSPK